MAYKSVINIDYKNSKKILDDLKKKRNKTTYNSTKGTQSQANSKNTTSSSSSRRNADGTWKNQTMVTGNYFGNGAAGTKKSTQKNNTNKRSSTTYNYRDMLNPNYNAQKQNDKTQRQNTTSRDMRSHIANNHKGQSYKKNEGYVQRYASSSAGYGTNKKTDFGGDYKKTYTNEEIQKLQKENRERIYGKQDTVWKNGKKSLGGIEWGRPKELGLQAPTKSEALQKGIQQYDKYQKNMSEDVGGLHDDEYEGYVNSYLSTREIKTADDVFNTSGDVAKYLQSEIDKNNQQIDALSEKTVREAKTKKDLDDISAQQEELRRQNTRLQATMNAFKGESNYSLGVQKRDWTYDNDPDAAKHTEQGRKNETFINGMTDEDWSYAMARSAVIGMSEDDTLRAASRYMTKRERDIYYATWDTEGEEGAKDYLRNLYQYGELGQRVSEAADKMTNADVINTKGMEEGFEKDASEVVNAATKGIIRYGGTFTTGIGNSLEGMGDAVMRGVDADYIHAENIGKKLYALRKQENPDDIGLDIAFNTGNMMPAIAVSVATQGAGAPAVVAAAASSAVTGVSTFGNTYQDARRQGYTADEATTYAVVTGVSEAALQYALNGVASMAGGSLTEAAQGAVTGKIASVGAKVASKEALTTSEKVIARLCKTEASQAIMSKILVAGIGSIGEFEEESLQGILEPVFRNAFLGELNNISPIREDVLYQGALGALSAGVMNIPSVAAEISNENALGRQAIKTGEFLDAINSDMSSLPEDSEVLRRANDIKENGMDNTPDGTAGRFMRAFYRQQGVENEIRAYKGGDSDWDTLSDEARATLVTPKNAKYLSEKFGFKVNENMTPDEMRNAVEQTAKESYAKENRRSFDEFIEDRLSNAQSDEEVNKIKEFAEQNRELYKDTEKATGRKVIIADLGRDSKGNIINGYATADKIVLSSEIANTETGAKFVLGHEITHGTELSKHYNALLDSARKYYGDKWDAEVENIQKIYSKKGSSFSVAQAEREVVANFVGSKVFTDLESMKAFVRDHKTTARRIMSWLKSKFTNTSGTDNTVLREAYNNFERAFNEIDRSIEGKRATVQYQMNLARGVQFSSNTNDMEVSARQNSLEGITEDGRFVFKSNFPKNTERAVKALRIVNLVQNVWSKEPIGLTIWNSDGTQEHIEARFDPNFGPRTDLSKIAFGNRMGTASEQRMTLDLADDLQFIAETSEYSRSKEAIPKDYNPAHEGVTGYHYFVNDIVYQPFESDEEIPCRMNIDVKVNKNGEYFYSFHLDKDTDSRSVTEKRIAQQTLHAAVGSNATNDSLNSNIDQDESDVNTGRQYFIEEDPQVRKQNQFDIIQQMNPIHDDYHVGIRSVDDIKSFNEAFNDANTEEEFVYPDWTRKDGQRVVETGRVTVYSAYPIENGVFVSPSRMMAQDYAAGGHVYSKTIRVDSVAWINADEGQYADISVEDEIAAYTKGDKKRSEMTDQARKMMIDPQNADYLAKKYGLDISSDMSSEEIEAKLSEIARRSRETEKANYDKWQNVSPASRHQSRWLDLTDDRNVARYRHEVDDVMKDSTRRNVMVGMPNEILINAGLNNVELIIASDDIIKMAYPEGYMKNNPNQNRHNLGFSAVKNLIYQLAEPVAITENTLKQQTLNKERGKNSIVVFTEWENEDGRIIVPIEIDLSTNTIKLPNKVNTAYGAGEAYLDSFDTSKILYPEGTKKDLRALLQESRQPVPESSSDDVFANNIYDDENFVKFNEENDVIKGRQASLDEGTEEKSEARQILDNAGETYGTMKPGENPVREANMPKKTSENRFVSRFARNLYEAEATTDEMIPALDSGIAAEDFSYERIANAKLQKGAETIIKQDGLQSARKQWDGVAERSDAATAQDIALGQYLYNEYVKAGDYDNAIQVAMDLARKATTAGQTVQAFRLLKKLTPDGQLYTLEKLASDYNKQLAKRKIKGFKGIEIDENLAKQLLEAKSKTEIQAAREAIMQNIADQVPATWVDKLNAWRYMSMLFNPRTHIRNIVGNAFFVPMRGFKDLIGAGMESAMQRSGRLSQEQRTKTVVNPFAKENKPLFEKAKQAFDENVDIIRGEDKYGKSDIDQRRRIFKSKVLNWIDKFNSAMLEKEDVIFMKKAFVDSYAKAMKARGLTAETMTAVQENEITFYAIKEAQKATYRDANALATALNKFKQSNKAAHLIGEGLFPFTKTPLNILKRGIEYSPLGIIKGTYQALNGVRNGNVTAAEAIDSMASGLSGTSIMALGAWLASQGLIKGGRDDDDEGALDSLQGGQEYSLVIGDKSYTLDWAAPVAMPLFIGVEMFNSVDKDNEGGANFSRIVDSITKISDPLFNLSMLSSLNSAIDSIKYSEGSPLTEIGINVFTSYAGQYVPTLLGQFARIIDENQRKTFYAKGSNMPKAVDSLWQGAVKKIPGLSMIMQPSIDRWGREKKTENVTERVLENLVSPGYYSERSSDDVDKEVDRLYVQIGDAGVIPPAAEKSIKWNNSKTKESGEINLTAEQYTKYSKRLGELCYNGVQDLIKSDAYKQLTDRERADAIGEIYDYAKQIAKNEITNGKYELKKWTQVLQENQDVLGDYAIYKTKISGEDMDTKEKRVMLQSMKMPDDVREQIYRASFSKSDIEQLDEAEKGGARFEQFLSMKIAMDEIDDSDSKNKSADKKDWLVKNISSERSLKALYSTFFETDNTNERNTIDYAVSQGVGVESFINREVQKSTEESDYSDASKKDYVYQVVNGEAQILTDEKGVAVYGSKMKKAFDHMLHSGYNEDEMTYFYQREYGSDDMFVFARMSGMDAKTYIEARDSTLMLTADKDENGKSISGTKKIKVIEAINALRTSRINKLIMFSKSYKLSTQQYQDIIDYVKELKGLSAEEKLQVLEGLKIEVIDGVAYPRKAA